MRIEKEFDEISNIYVCLLLFFFLPVWWAGYCLFPYFFFSAFLMRVPTFGSKHYANYQQPKGKVKEDGRRGTDSIRAPCFFSYSFLSILILFP